MGPAELAQTVAQTLAAAGVRSFGETVRHDPALAATFASAPSHQDGPVGPRTIDPGALPLLATTDTQASAGGDPADLVVRELLGSGGMGTVELARQRSLSRDVALKRARDADAESQNAALVREAVFTGFLEHPNIVPIHALGRDARAHPLLVMKKVEGTTLAALLGDPGHRAWTRAGDDRVAVIVGAMRAVCDALAFAHSRGVLHRDIKPENVMLGTFGEIYLLDWGVATRLGDPHDPDAIVGTPSYLAPEMLQPAEPPGLDARTDVYLVGATLHECLTGKPPHHGSTLEAVLLHAARSEPPTYPDDVPTELAAIARRALQRERDDRFASAAAMGEALAEFERHRATSTIVDEAEKRLAELTERLGRGDQAEEELEALFYECRFGFEQALRAWPSNNRTRAGLVAAATAMCGFHLAHKNRAAAAALLATLDPKPIELVAGLEALTLEDARSHEERARLRHLEHEMDISVAEPERRRAASVVGVLVTLGALGITFAYVRFGFRPSVWSVMFMTVPGGLLVGTVVLLGRRRFFQNRANRQIALTFAFLASSVILHRALGALAGHSLAEVASGDAIIVSAVTAVASLSLRRVYLVPSVLFLITGMVTPHLGSLAFAPMLGAAALSIAALVFAPPSMRGPLLGDAPPASRREGAER